MINKENNGDVEFKNNSFQRFQTNEYASVDV